jgi:Icc-related predicted phosphoesterase
MIKEIAPSAIYLEDSGCEIDGIKFWGSPYTPTFFNWYFNRDRGAAIKRHWDMIPEGTDALITHGPPKGFLDWNPQDKFHCGCEDLLDRVMEIQPQVHAFGHIHSGYGQTVVGDTSLINASICDHRYQPVNAPIEFEL